MGRPGAFERTGNRRDFSLPPVGNTVLDDLTAAGIPTYGVGKIEDIFAHRGLAKSNHAAGNPACVKATLDYLGEMKSGFLFVNLVDFDSQYGHRNNAEGYGRALEQFDKALPDIMAALGREDLLLITADHGCDPTTPSTDHSREYVPAFGMVAGHGAGRFAGHAAHLCGGGCKRGGIFRPAHALSGRQLFAKAF